MIESVLPAMDVLPRLLLGFIGAGLVSFLAARVNALSASGAGAATLVGTAAVGAGWDFAALLLGFFISATVVSRYRSSVKNERLASIVEKGNARDAFQVFANGFVFAVCALWMILAPGEPPIFAAVGALAGACADTWATEIGSLSRKTPRSILSGRPVQTGTSGGITMLGAVAAGVGAVSVVLVAFAAGMPSRLFAAGLTGGLAGAAADSVLGAAVQSRRWCPSCKEHTERKIHTCDTQTTPASGLLWLDNDAVNFACTLVAALTSALWVL